jgi:hypothetical protein
MSTTEAATIDDLRKDFHELYGNGHDFEGETLAEILVRIAQLVGDIVGRETAAVGFAAIARALDCAVKIDAEWQSAIEQDANDAYCWPMGVKFHDLNAYGYYGIALNGGRDSAEREAIIKAQIDATSAFMAFVPFEAWGIKPGDAGRTLQRARARFALDTGQAVRAEDLALLGDVSEGRIRNMMAGKEKAFSSEQGRIPASEALAWLAGRPESFRPSRWRDQNTFEDLRPTRAEIDEVVFVPVAADGSTFHPGLVRDGVFSVGRGLQETHHQTFDEALATLQKLADPCWSRPTTGRGSWTTVSATRWDRLSRVELDRLAA